MNPFAIDTGGGGFSAPSSATSGLNAGYGATGVNVGGLNTPALGGFSQRELLIGAGVLAVGAILFLARGRRRRGGRKS